MKTSVLITVYNRPEMLLACLRALALSRVRIDEAVVSDDGSDEQNARQMQGAFGEFPFKIRFVRQEHNGYRLAAARNNAIRAATGDYLVSIDCDILLLPEAIETHLRRARPGLFLAGNRAFLNENDTVRVTSGNLEKAGRDVPACPQCCLPAKASPQAMPAGAKPSGISMAHSAAADSPYQPEATKLTPRLLEALWDAADKKDMINMHRRFQRNLLLRRLGLAAAHKPKILGCHFSLYREDVLKVNGFDEKFTGWGFEDDDFARRLYLAGLRGASVILEARALHLWHAPVSSMPKTITASSNWYYFRRKNAPAYCAEGLKS